MSLDLFEEENEEAVSYYKGWKKSLGREPFPEEAFIYAWALGQQDCDDAYQDGFTEAQNMLNPDPSEGMLKISKAKILETLFRWAKHYREWEMDSLCLAYDEHHDEHQDLADAEMADGRDLVIWLCKHKDDILSLVEEETEDVSNAWMNLDLMIPKDVLLSCDDANQICAALYRLLSEVKDIEENRVINLISKLEKEFPVLGSLRMIKRKT